MDARQKALETLKSCPVCEAFVETVEYGVCEIIRRKNPRINPDFCRRLLRTRITEGKPIKEIAEKLGVTEDELKHLVKEVSEYVDREFMRKIRYSKKNK